MKHLYPFLLLLLIAFSHTISAQHFEWAASAGNIDIRYNYSSVDPENNIVVGGGGGVNWSHMGRQPELYTATGEQIKLSQQERTDVIACYSPDGAVLWHLQTDQRNTELSGIAHDENGTTVLLVEILAVASENGEEYGYFPELERHAIIPAGFYLIYLNKEGRLIKKVKVFDKEPERIDISGFIPYPNGGFVLSGFLHPGVLSETLKLSAGPAGGDFVLVLDKEGQPAWGDVISFARTTCCTQTSESVKASVAPNGTVYLGGNFLTGATFGGAKKIMAPTSPNDNMYNEPYEAYIASYSPQGKLNWVRTTKARWQCQSVAATNNGVVIAFKTMSNNIFLGEKVDTTGGKWWVLAILDRAGNTKWKTTSSTDRAHQVRFDRENHLYVLGTHRETGKWNNSPGVIGTDTVQSKFAVVYIAKFDPNGKYEWIKEADIPITTSNESLHFNMDHCGNMYVSGTLWFTFSAQLSMFDKAFVKGKIYGPAPFISRFKNTISSSIVKQKKDEPVLSCILSPGPWKLRNYPNPFATNTTIEYSLTYPDAVSLEIYNVSGQVIKTLFQNKKHVAGQYTIPLNGELPAGIYVATLRGTETMVTWKMVVAK
ncbi:T9SS type A sorting domain-containing protein [Aridibaculum aurantiacum]|uniref:T9SS type A sorting domain-containing protein n=1 Tax=Aridibaculum aurantiacum TaxID=2810307 RepID=UPI001A95B488|nr:T9SS type A sorting domain-containing protein [Aridibaculum aurantiacum]